MNNLLRIRGIGFGDRVGTILPVVENIPTLEPASVRLI
jgi:hypothetical protein